MATKTFKGELEIDADRGVIYFHSGVSGHTVLRVCQVPKELLADSESIDITLGFTKSRKLNLK